MAMAVKVQTIRGYILDWQYQYDKNTVVAWPSFRRDSIRGRRYIYYDVN